MSTVSIRSCRGYCSLTRQVVNVSLLLFTVAIASSCSSGGGDRDSMSDQSEPAIDDSTRPQLTNVTTTFPDSDIVGDVNSYLYDQAGRVTSIASQSVLNPQGARVTTELQYEGGILSSVNGLRDSTTFSIQAGRIETRTVTSNNGLIRTTRYTYDEGGRIVQVLDGTFDFTRGCQPGPGAGDGNYSLTWDDSQLVNIISDAGDFTASYTYDAAGLVASRTIDRSCESSADIERYLRDESGLLVRIERTSGPEGNVETEERSYDESGRIVGSAFINADNEPSELSRQTYDSLGRMVRWSTVRNGIELVVRTFEYTTGTCAEQLWTDPERSVTPDSTVSLNRAPGATQCAYRGSLR